MIFRIKDLESRRTMDKGNKFAVVEKRILLCTTFRVVQKKEITALGLFCVLCYEFEAFLPPPFPLPPRTFYGLVSWSR